jgi:hypothetical protein
MGLSISLPSSLVQLQFSRLSAASISMCWVSEFLFPGKILGTMKIAMKKSSPACNPDAYVAGLRGWQRTSVDHLRSFVSGVVTKGGSRKMGSSCLLIERTRPVDSRGK